MDKSELKETLDSLALLEDERKMWYKIGFYIPLASDNSLEKTTSLYDVMGNREAIRKIVAFNLRTAIITWWQEEKKFPKNQEVVQDPTGLDSLEARNNS